MIFPVSESVLTLANDSTYTILHFAPKQYSLDEIKIKHDIKEHGKLLWWIELIITLFNSRAIVIGIHVPGPFISTRSALIVVNNNMHFIKQKEVVGIDEIKDWPTLLALGIDVIEKSDCFSNWITFKDDRLSPSVTI